MNIKYISAKTHAKSFATCEYIENRYALAEKGGTMRQNKVASVRARVSLHYRDLRLWMRKRSVFIRIRFLPYISNLFCERRKHDALFVLLPDADCTQHDIWKAYTSLMFSNENWVMLIPQERKVPLRLQKCRRIVRSIPNSRKIILGVFSSGVRFYPFALSCFASEAEKGADFLFCDQMEKSKENTPQKKLLLRPGFDKVFLESCDYLGDVIMCSPGTLTEEECKTWSEGGFRRYELALLLANRAKRPKHIPQILYTSIRCSVVNTAEVLERRPKETLSDKALHPAGIEKHQVQDSVPQDALVSIVIPNRNHLSDLRRCVTSIMNKTTDVQYEIVIVENGSTETELLSYYKELTEQHVRILCWTGDFNFAGICNFAASQAAGNYLLFLNNDTEVVSEDWLTEMLRFACRTDMGAVGAQLRYPDETIQHAGVLLGVGGIAGHAYKGLAPDDMRNMMQLQLAHSCAAVTGACLMIRKDRYMQAGGMDESFPVAYNDVDLCLRLMQMGYTNVYTPYAVLYHAESKTRGYETGENIERFKKESAQFKARWKECLEAGDPYLHPLYSRDTETYTL